MKITRQDVERVAHLARLRFSAGELEPLTGQLNGILEYFETLQAVDTSGVAPSTHAVQVTNAFRDDLAQPSLEPQRALGNAPDAEQTLFAVPKIIEV